MKAIKLQCKTGNQKYPIIIGNDIFKKLKKILKENSINFNQCLVIDKKLPKKLISKIFNSLPGKNKYIHYFTASEKNKKSKKC